MDTEAETLPAVIVLPGPRWGPMFLGAPYWVGFTAFWLLSSGGPNSAIGWVVRVLWLVPTAYVVYLGLYVWFGREVISVDSERLVSERRLFGTTTRRRAYDLNAMGPVQYRPTSFLDRWNKLNLHVGLDEGCVAFMFRGGTVRIAEGLYHDDERSQALAERLDRIVNMARQQRHPD